MQNLLSVRFPFQRCAMNKKYSLCSLAEEFILYKQRLGCNYETSRFYLMNYVRYTEKSETGEMLLDKESVKRYLDTLGVHSVKNSNI